MKLIALLFMLSSLQKFRTSKRNDPSSSMRSNALHLYKKASFAAVTGKALFGNETTVTKIEFVLKYPQFLISVTTEYDPHVLSMNMDDEKSELDFPGVDICFHDLTLSIEVGQKSVDVVDHVTGRVQAKTMTALMGGSGAGKCVQ
jgi:ABC-type multidrug transport system fused ATPase/permease subunit